MLLFLLFFFFWFWCCLALPCCVLDQNVAADISEFEACHRASGKRVEGVYQSEGCIKEAFLSDALLFTLVLHIPS